MSLSNGRDDLYLQIVGLVERLNGHLLVSNEQRASFLERLESLESEVEDLKDKEGERHTSTILKLGELESLIKRVREDTDPRGFAKLDPAQYPLRKKEDDDGALVAAARLAEKVPPTWVAWVLKLGLPITGAIGLRLWQWFVAGH